MATLSSSWSVVHLTTARLPSLTRRLDHGYSVPTTLWSGERWLVYVRHGRDRRDVVDRVLSLRILHCIATRLGVHRSHCRSWCLPHPRTSRQISSEGRWNIQSMTNVPTCFSPLCMFSGCLVNITPSRIAIPKLAALLGSCSPVMIFRLVAYVYKRLDRTTSTTCHHHAQRTFIHIEIHLSLATLSVTSIEVSFTVL